MILAIDTSCYTTSLALMDSKSRLIADIRRLLRVEKGARGLRQSEALYAHNQNLPPMLEELFSSHTAAELTGIAVSSRPRPLADSYMPVFSAGLGIARILAATLQLPLYQYSHQEGHLAAALWSRELSWQESFLALHLSGGTGEVLHVQPHITAAAKSDIAYHIECIGDTDLPPGQFVDRIGVALGYPFPAGAALDELALSATSKDFRLSGSVKGMHISFSGPESAAQRAITNGIAPSEVAKAVFDNIGKSLAKVIETAQEKTNCDKIIIMGGVAASRNLRNYLAIPKVVFANAKYCSDNAVGIASLALKHSDDTSFSRV